VGVDVSLIAGIDKLNKLIKFFLWLWFLYG